MGMRAIIGALLVTVTVAGPALAAGLPVPQAPGWLGVAMGTRPSIDPGIAVQHVVRGSPAEKAGLKEADRIVRVDGGTVADAAEVTRVVARHSPGSSVSVTVVRESKEVTLTATVASRPTSTDIARMEYVGVYAPAWTKLVTVSGTMPASVQSMRGKVAVIEFWATWCGPCRLTAPTLASWQAKYGPQGLAVVGITTDEPQVAADHARKTGLGFAAAADVDATTTKAYGVTSLPTLFVVDRAGVVRDVVLGYEPGQEARTEKLVQTLLAEPAPPP
jgi:thiol-disulfide isomerase/thioredoxin